MTEQNRPERLLSPGEVADILGVDPKTVARWAVAGSIPFTRTVGGHRRYKPADVYRLRDHGPDPQPEVEAETPEDE